MSRETGLLRVTSQGPSRPFLKTLATVFLTQLTTPGSPRMGSQSSFWTLISFFKTRSRPVRFLPRLRQFRSIFRVTDASFCLSFFFSSYLYYCKQPFQNFSKQKALCTLSVSHVSLFNFSTDNRFRSVPVQVFLTTWKVKWSRTLYVSSSYFS